MEPLPERTQTSRSNTMLAELPMEIHLNIRNQILNDPDMKTSQLRSLRLVCKMFDNIWKPSVMCNLALVPSNLAHPPYHALVQYLQSLAQHEKSKTTLHYTTLTIRNCHRLETEFDRFSTDIRQLWREGLVKTLVWILFVIFTHFIVVLVSLSFFLILLLVLPHRIPYHIGTVLNTHRARRLISSLPEKLDLSNIRSCRLLLDSRERDWAVDRSTNLLVSLPHLTELELGISIYTDMEYVVRRLAPLTTLRKLTLLRATAANASFQTQRLSTLIARNGHHLTHLNYDLRSTDIPPDLSDLFSSVPADKPLRLQHVSLNGACTNYEALAPHTQSSLLSFEYHSRSRNPWCIPFGDANIFPPTIKVESVDPLLVGYIRTHPGIASLAITTCNVPQSAAALENIRLFHALAQHANTLRSLSLNTKLFALLLRQDSESEIKFLECAKNLKEVVLEVDTSVSDYHNPSNSIHNEKRIFPVIALLNRSLNVVIRTRDEIIFRLCVERSLRSENPLVRDLARRIAQERST